MNRATAEKKLAALGFEIDWNCTTKTYDGWSGTMDATGRGQIDGDCRGEVIHGDTLAEFLTNAINEAKHYAAYGPNSQCADPECDLHMDYPLEDPADDAKRLEYVKGFGT